MARQVSADAVRAPAPSSTGRPPRVPARERLLPLLVLPVLLFILVIVLVPVGRFLLLAVDNSDLADGFVETGAALVASPVAGVPAEPVFAALVHDLARARTEGRDALIAQALNQRVVGTRFLLLKTAKEAADGRYAAPVRDRVLAAHPEWGRPEIWRAIEHNRSRFTDYYLLATYDLERDAAGKIVDLPPDRALFRVVLLRTLWISAVVTLICALLAVPLAQAMAAAPPAVSRLLLAMVLFPLWSSLLVRTIIWIIVLQTNGPINAVLAFFRLIDQPLSLIYGRFSLTVAMVQVLLPLMVLSVLSVLKRISPNYMRAALSLGAPWHVAWLTVQLPLILPGIVSGAAIVFVFSLGYYITPTLVGGPTDQMISSFIAFYTNHTLNWGLAAALSLQLLVVLGLVAAAFAGVRALATRRAVQ